MRKYTYRAILLAAVEFCENDDGTTHIMIPGATPQFDDCANFMGLTVKSYLVSAAPPEIENVLLRARQEVARHESTMPLPGDQINLDRKTALNAAQADAADAAAKTEDDIETEPYDDRTLDDRLTPDREYP